MIVRMGGYKYSNKSQSSDGILGAEDSSILLQRWFWGVRTYVNFTKLGLTACAPDCILVVLQF